MKKLLLILALSCTAFAQVSISGKASISGNVSLATGTGCSAAYFSDTFDRADSATVGGSWTTETDTGGLLSISSNTLLMTHSSATAAFVTKDSLSNYTEVWQQFDVTLSAVTGWGNANALYLFALKDSNGNAQLYCRALASSGGVPSTLDCYYKNSAGSTVNPTAAWTPAAGTKYTIKTHMKYATGAGANNGILGIWINGSQVINQTTQDTFYDAHNFNLLQFGVPSTSVANTALLVTFDNYVLRGDDCF